MFYPGLPGYKLFSIFSIAWIAIMVYLTMDLNSVMLIKQESSGVPDRMDICWTQGNDTIHG